jgi:hypothetical protein
MYDSNTYGNSYCRNVEIAVWVYIYVPQYSPETFVTIYQIARSGIRENCSLCMSI